jgi:hypothetical protein
VLPEVSDQLDFEMSLAFVHHLVLEQAEKKDFMK